MARTFVLLDHLKDKHLCKITKDEPLSSIKLPLNTLVTIESPEEDNTSLVLATICKVFHRDIGKESNVTHYHCRHVDPKLDAQYKHNRRAYTAKDIKGFYDFKYPIEAGSPCIVFLRHQWELGLCVDPHTMRPKVRCFLPQANKWIESTKNATSVCGLPPDLVEVSKDYIQEYQKLHDATMAAAPPTRHQRKKSAEEKAEEASKDDKALKAKQAQEHQAAAEKAQEEARLVE